MSRQFWNPRKIFYFRAQAELSQKELARKLDVHKITISRWETGLNVPSIMDVISLASVLGKRVEDFIDEEDDR
jgi:DNA-binding XRE family transcriptional regulator